MKLVLVAFVTAAISAPTGEKTASFVEQFAGVCIAPYGDFAAVKQAVKAAGLRKGSLSADYPESILARRGDNVIIYRGDTRDGASNKPNCSIQSHKVPGNNVEEVAEALKVRLGLSDAARSANCQGRPVWKWRYQHNGRDVSISLVDDVLVGDRNVRLAIMPWTDEKPACREPVIRRVQR
jgi:hypothetical protein